MRALAAVGLAGLLALGCEGQKSSPPTATTSAHEAATSNQAATPSQAATSTQVATANPVPAEEDFEERAESTITPANANDELTKLEKEIGP